VTSTSNNIIVQTILWEIEAPNMSVAEYWQDVAGKCSRNVIPRMLEEGLKDINRGDEVIIIDKLVLDLNSINNEEDLDEKLREVIKKNTGLLSNTADGLSASLQSRQTGLSRSLLLQFEYYLDHGSLGWSGDVQKMNEPANVFALIEKMQEEELKKWLVTNISAEESLTRFVEYFTEIQLLKILDKGGIPQQLVQEYFYFIELITQITEITNDRLGSVCCLFICMLNEKNPRMEKLVALWLQQVYYSHYYRKEEKQKVAGFIKSLKQKEVKESINTYSGSGKKIDSSLLNRLVSTLRNLHEPGWESPAGKMAATSFSLPEKNKKQDDLSRERKYFVENAGAVLLYPYLRHYFDKEGFLNDSNVFTENKNQLLACYWLQFIITGNTEIKEYELVLNKILCGYNLDAPLIRVWSNVAAEKQQADIILKAIISKWKRIGNTSPDVFRNSFLLRNGRIIEEETCWLLTIERKGIDVLLETLPYPVSIVKLPWMPKPIFVQW
jgi:hypothetical protein